MFISISGGVSNGTTRLVLHILRYELETLSSWGNENRYFLVASFTLVCVDIERKYGLKQDLGHILPISRFPFLTKI